MKLTRSEFIKTSIAGMLAFFAGGLIGCKDKKSALPKENPYEYNIDKFKQVDSSLILYKEASPISVNVQRIKGLAIAGDDTIFAAGNKKVFVFSPAGIFLKSFMLGNEPHSIALNSDNQLIVAFKEKIEVYTRNGSKTASWSSLGEKAHITAVACGKDVTAAADYGNKQIWIFNNSGSLKKLIGADHAGHKHSDSFHVPSPYFDIKFDKNNTLWAVNPGKHSIEQYSLDGKKLSSWGKASMELDGFAGCCNPTHFNFLPTGEFITAEKGLVRIKIHNRSGNFTGVAAEPGKFKELTTGLILAVNSKAHIFAADSIKKQIRIFAPK